MVINFAVKDDPEIFVFVGQRLVAGLDINDAEAAHGKSDPAFHEQAAIVRATMNDLIIHRSQAFALNSRVTLRQKDSANSAHKLTSCRLHNPRDIDCDGWLYQSSQPMVAHNDCVFLRTQHTHNSILTEQFAIGNRLRGCDDFTPSETDLRSATTNQCAAISFTIVSPIDKFRVARPLVERPISARRGENHPVFFSVYDVSVSAGA